ncbi:hypothetical protein LUZ60_008367 [Juncus effusus]|nr:hypothetical protein LUZ60_008367 [Juncus effusus]
MARIVVSRALPFSASRSRISRAISAAAASSSSSFSLGHASLSRSAFDFDASPIWRRSIHFSAGYARPLPFAGYLSASLRSFRKLRRRNGAAAAAKKLAPPPKDSEVELCVRIGIHDDLPNDAEILNIAEMLKLNAPKAMQIAFEGLKDSVYETREKSITNVGKYEKVEFSIVLCNDECVKKLHNESRGEDRAADVLPISQQVTDLDIPTLMLGEVAISVETALRQAEERGHTLLDEIRILLVQGLLHLLGFNQDSSDESKEEMEKEETFVLKTLGWKNRGLTNIPNNSKILNENISKSLRFYRPKFRYIFCDMDGTLLNSKSQISEITADALKQVISRGVKIIIATGKTRPAVIKAFKDFDLVGKNGVVSASSPGVFLQGLLVYGMQGREIFRRNLDLGVCKEAFIYSKKYNIPLIAFCQDRCLTLFEHPSVDSLHTVYHEPKAEIIPSIDELLSTAEIQKMIFLDTEEGVSTTLRPYWEEAIKSRAGVVQAVPDMLEIVPPKTSKGKGVISLLHHLNVSPKEIMAIGDGENDMEMLQLAGLGIALANGSDKTKSVADVIGSASDDDGAAEAIFKYAF